MTLLIVGIAALVVVIVAALLSAAISEHRPAQPCYFDGKATIIVGETRICIATSCDGKPTNVYYGVTPVTYRLTGLKACDAHQGYMLDLGDVLTRESGKLR